MRYKTSCSLRADLVDHDGSAIGNSTKLTRKLDGLSCTTDSVLNYAELPFAEECALRGGYIRLILAENGQLTLSVEIDSQRKLTRKEIGVLCEDLEGQLTDGIGAGCFDKLTVATGLCVQVRAPLRMKFVQAEGTAWRPKPSSQKSNEQKMTAVAKMIKLVDAAPVSVRVSRKSTIIGSSAASTASKKGKPNYKALFRFLGKPERNQFFDQIKAELEAIGNDLSMVEDGEYPYGNLSDPKLLRLLLNAGLPPETVDSNGCSLLIQAACEPKCLDLLLKTGADVNRICDNHVAATALIRAASIGKLQSVQFLLSHGANPKIEDRSGDTAIDHIDEYSRSASAIEKLLRSAVRQ